MKKKQLLVALKDRIGSLSAEADGQLRGGFAAVDGDSRSVNMNDNFCSENEACNDNTQCYRNKSCNNNTTCDNNTKCYGNHSCDQSNNACGKTAGCGDDLLSFGASIF